MIKIKQEGLFNHNKNSCHNDLSVYINRLKKENLSFRQIERLYMTLGQSKKVFQARLEKAKAISSSEQIQKEIKIDYLSSVIIQNNNKSAVSVIDNFIRIIRNQREIDQYNSPDKSGYIGQWNTDMNSKSANNRGSKQNKIKNGLSYNEPQEYIPPWEKYYNKQKEILRIIFNRFYDKISLFDDENKEKLLYYINKSKKDDIAYYEVDKLLEKEFGISLYYFKYNLQDQMEISEEEYNKSRKQIADATGKEFIGMRISYANFLLYGYNYDDKDIYFKIIYELEKASKRNTMNKDYSIYSKKSDISKNKKYKTKVCPTCGAKFNFNDLFNEDDKIICQSCGDWFYKEDLMEFYKRNSRGKKLY